MPWIGPESGMLGVAIATIGGAATSGGPVVGFSIAAAAFSGGGGAPQVIAYVVAWSLFSIQRIIGWGDSSTCRHVWSGFARPSRCRCRSSRRRPRCSSANRDGVRRRRNAPARASRSAGGITSMPSFRKVQAPTLHPSRRNAASHKMDGEVEPVTERLGPEVDADQHRRANVLPAHRRSRSPGRRPIRPASCSPDCSPPRAPHPTSRRQEPSRPGRVPQAGRPRPESRRSAPRPAPEQTVRDQRQHAP